MIIQQQDIFPSFLKENSPQKSNVVLNIPVVSMGNFQEVFLIILSLFSNLKLISA